MFPQSDLISNPMPNWKQNASGLKWLEPNWSAPSCVKAISSTRIGGESSGPYSSLNLGSHVGDDGERVINNRRLLQRVCNLPTEPEWLNQVHGCEVAALPEPGACSLSADAAWTDKPNAVCTVMTADCLPLLLCNAAGSEVAAVHAGWRGLCDGVIEATINKFSVHAEELLAWLGPAIGPSAFEVGGEVRDAFMAVDSEADTAFKQKENGKWMANIFALARMRLRKAGVSRVDGGELCTYSDDDHFFSYRRDGITGRMATMIWIAPEGS